MVGQEYQHLAGAGVLEADAAQVRRIMPVALLALEGDGLVAEDTGRAIRRR